MPPRCASPPTAAMSIPKARWRPDSPSPALLEAEDEAGCRQELNLVATTFSFLNARGQATTPPTAVNRGRRRVNDNQSPNTGKHDPVMPEKIVKSGRMAKQLKFEKLDLARTLEQLQAQEFVKNVSIRKTWPVETGLRNYARELEII
nr:hypothetical protein Iba_chr03bCG4040 [Ipomoea batatas]